MTKQKHVVDGPKGFIKSLSLILWHTFSWPMQNSRIETREIISSDFSNSPDFMFSLQQKPDSDSKKQPIHLHKEFKLVLLSVIGLTVVAGVAHIVLAAIWLSPTENQQTAFDAMSFTWKVGFGAICGLLGGKAG